MVDFKKIPWQVYLRIILGIGGVGGGLHTLLALLDPTGFVKRMTTFAGTTPFSWYGEMVKSVFIPNAGLVIYLLSAIAILGGILLILGLFIKFGCVLGIPVCLHFTLLAPIYAIINIPLLIGFLIIFFSEKSKRYGLDEKIFKRFPESE